MGFPFYFKVGVVFLVYSYVLYPLLLKAMLKKKRKITSYPPTAVVPSLSIVIAAHNEEKVLREKLDSILNCTYPQQQIELLIGIDNSTDF
ncbi:MAG: glycosyltransferase, partial [Sphingomonadales bacterium]